MTPAVKRTVSLLAALVLLAGVIFGRPAHPHFAWEAIPGFYAFFGLAGCWLLVAVLKSFGNRRLQRPESYYDE